MSLTTISRPLLRLSVTCLLVLLSAVTFAQVNNACNAATLLTSGAAPAPVLGTVKNATATAGVTNCGNSTNSADVWYSFVAQSAFPNIALTGVQSSLRSAGYAIQVFSSPACTVTSPIACGTATAATATLNLYNFNPATPLIIGQTYYIRIATNNNSATTSGANWDFSIAVIDPKPDLQISRSYINITKGTNGGTVDPGDILEMRATFVARTTGGADSLSFTDTLFRNKGLALVPGSIALRTNEGIVYRTDVAVKVPFTDDSTDADAGYWRRPNGQDTIIRINFGTGATRSKRGLLLNTSNPTVFGTTCIVMATYRVRVYAPYNTKISYKTGAVTYRNIMTNVLTNGTFKSDSLIVYQSVGLCPNAVSATNSIGVEFNGTFGTPAVGPTNFPRNRGTSGFVYGYGYMPFTAGANNNGPGDYFYSIANNTFAENATVTTNWPKPDVAPKKRLFGHWDISGDHTNAANPLMGNPPCDTTLPVSTANPCGYMLTINSAYRTDTAFQYDVTGLCPNTYYEISAWFKNLCAKCGADSAKRSFSDVGYIPSAPNDSSGVRPNIAFDVNGTDYYTTGDIVYEGTATGGRDSGNQWHKKGFTYLTGAGQTSFRLTLRNNAPGGGGNDWALDDIAVATCLPNMSYSPSLAPTVCMGNALTINDTIRSYFNNYAHNQWQRSTDNGVTWANVGSVTSSTPVYNNTLSTWQYVTSYTIPPANTTPADNGNRYRVIVATSTSNVASSSCQVTDGFSIINLTVQNCAPVLATDLLAFDGKLKDTKAALTWTSSKEDRPLVYHIQRSTDGISFQEAGSVKSYELPFHESNNYQFTDPLAVNGTTYYRLLVSDGSGSGKYSRIIQLSSQPLEKLELTSVLNPFVSTLSFEIRSSADTKVQVQLTDLFGKVIRKTTNMVNRGINPLVIDETSSLPAGTYILSIKSNDVLITRKVVKKN